MKKINNKVNRYKINVKSVANETHNKNKEILDKNRDEIRIDYQYHFLNIKYEFLYYSFSLICFLCLCLRIMLSFSINYFLYYAKWIMLRIILKL